VETLCLYHLAALQYKQLPQRCRLFLPSETKDLSLSGEELQNQIQCPILSSMRSGLHPDMPKEEAEYHSFWFVLKPNWLKLSNCRRPSRKPVALWFCAVALSYNKYGLFRPSDDFPLSAKMQGVYTCEQADKYSPRRTNQLRSAQIRAHSRPIPVSRIWCL